MRATTTGTLSSRAAVSRTASSRSKLRQLDDRRDGRIEFKAIGAGIEELVNSHIDRAGCDARVTLQRRPDGLAEPHLGAACTAMERRHAEAQGIDVRGMSMRSLLSTPGYTPATVRGVHLRAHHEAVAEIERRREEGKRQALQRAPVVEDERPGATAPSPMSPRRRPRTRRVKVEDERPGATAPRPKVAAEEAAHQAPEGRPANPGRDRANAQVAAAETAHPRPEGRRPDGSHGADAQVAATDTGHPDDQRRGARGGSSDCANPTSAAARTALAADDVRGASAHTGRGIAEVRARETVHPATRRR